jgi:hypothetical protein
MGQRTGPFPELLYHKQVAAIPLPGKVPGTVVLPSCRLPGSLAAGGTRLRRNHGEAADVPTIGTLGLQVEREQAGDHRHRGRDPVTVWTR